MLGDIVAGKEYRYEIYLNKPFGSFNGTTPVHEKIACLTNCAVITNFKKAIKNINELEFYINLYWNDVDNTKNDLFDLVQTGCYVQVDTYVGDNVVESEMFYIYQTEITGGDKEVKQAKCYSKQYQWNKIKVKNFQTTDYFDSTRKIYDGQIFDATTPVQGGILDYILQYKLMNTWSVSYISPSIANKYRTYDIYSSDG